MSKELKADEGMRAVCGKRLMNLKLMRMKKDKEKKEVDLKREIDLLL